MEQWALLHPKEVSGVVEQLFWIAVAVVIIGIVGVLACLAEKVLARIEPLNRWIEMRLQQDQEFQEALKRDRRERRMER